MPEMDSVIAPALFFLPDWPLVLSPLLWIALAVVGRYLGLAVEPARSSSERRTP
jgi:hypothetical protein